MKTIFVCSIKIVGEQFAVLTKEEAEKWVLEDSTLNYYSELKVKTYE